MAPDERRELTLENKELLTGFVKRQRKTHFFLPVLMAGSYALTNNIKVSRKNLLNWLEASCSKKASFKVNILAPDSYEQTYVFIYPQYNLPKEED